MSFFQVIWEKIKASPSIQYPHFMIPADRVIGEDIDQKSFVKDEAYFEIRIKEQFLQNGREYWNEYVPISIVLTDLIYDDRRSDFPFVVGPSLLKKIEEIKGNENISYKNTRVVGPTPYGGDQVTLFVGLFRIKTLDWGRQAIGLLESVAKSFDSTKLSSYVDIANPLMDGIENFLGMGKNMQLQIGHRMEYADPLTHTVDHFSPGYRIMVRSKAPDLSKQKFWVKNGQLFIGNSKDSIQAYKKSDYLLYNIKRLAKRTDYTTFDFHKKWKEVYDHIWNDNRQAATTAYHLLISNLRLSPDIISAQKNQLQAYYLALLKKEVQAYEKAKDPFAGIEATQKSIDITPDPSGSRSLSENLVKALQSTDQFLSHSEGAQSKSLDSDEGMISDALQSEFLNRKEILDIDPSEFSEAVAKAADLDINKRNS